MRTGTVPLDPAAIDGVGAAGTPRLSGAGEFRARPDAAAIAAVPSEELRAALGLTRARAETLSALAGAIAGGLDLGPGADRDRVRAELSAMRGIGPWTVELIAMRALGDPDAYPAGDLILHRAIGARTAREAREAAEGWRPYRGYATQHLWADFLEGSANGPASNARTTKETT